MANIREVSSLPIPRQLVDTLLQHGFRVCADINSMKPLDLADELGITVQEAMTIHNAAAASGMNSNVTTPGTGSHVITGDGNGYQVVPPASGSILAGKTNKDISKRAFPSHLSSSSKMSCFLFRIHRVCPRSHHGSVQERGSSDNFLQGSGYSSWWRCSDGSYYRVLWRAR